VNWQNLSQEVKIFVSLLPCSLYIVYEKSTILFSYETLKRRGLCVSILLFGLATLISHVNQLSSMNSLTLKEIGFSDLVPLCSVSFVNLPYDKSIVFALVDKTPSGKADSDILYIGRSKKPVKKILGSYLAGFGGKSSKRIYSKLFDEGYLEKIALTWIVSDNPRATQKEFLSKFAKEQSKYPDWNVTKKLPEKPKVKKKVAKPRSARKSAPP
jgi:hypothetical protein